MLRKRINIESLGYLYVMYAPSGAHKSFRIFKRYKDGASESVDSEALDQVNIALMKKQLTIDEARDQVQKIRDDLYTDDGIKTLALVFNSDNRKILNQYWEAEYVPRLVKLIDPRTARSELNRSVDAVGAVSLRTGSRNELQAALDASLKGNLQRRAVGKINSILKYLGRDFQLIKANKEFNEVQYVSMDELPKLLSHLATPELKLIHKAAFATGMRLGELLAVEARFYNRAAGTYKVTKQIDRLKVTRKTKNRKDRTTFVIAELRKDFEEWIELASSFDHELGLRISRYTKRAGSKAFPKKDLCFHDMRHSFAIHLLGKGVPLSHVAQCIGDSIAVAEEYYTGFDLSADAISLIDRLMKR